MQQIKNEKEKRIVCIVGPTACHKTECAILLAKRIDGEIVSADSVQVYRGMDIGSAKPSLEERQGIPHHLIDCLPIDTPEFSAAMFRSLAVPAIEDIAARRHAPSAASAPLRAGARLSGRGRSSAAPARHPSG